MSPEKRQALAIWSSRTLTSCTDILLQTVCVWSLSPFTAGHKGKESQNTDRSLSSGAGAGSQRKTQRILEFRDRRWVLKPCPSLGNQRTRDFYVVVFTPLFASPLQI